MGSLNSLKAGSPGPAGRTRILSAKQRNQAARVTALPPSSNFPIGRTQVALPWRSPGLGHFILYLPHSLGLLFKLDECPHHPHGAVI